MNNALLIEMANLLHQATTEQSHYYTAAVLSKAIKEIVQLESRVALLEGKLEQAHDEIIEFKRVSKNRAGKS